jgi:hypothetical protein
MFGMLFTGRNIAAALVIAVCLTVYAGAREVKSRVTGALDWEKMRIDVEMNIDLVSAEIRLPSGRTLAEETLFSHYFDRARPFILSIRLDSSSVIGDLVASGEIDPSMIDALARQSAFKTPAYSIDFSSISSSFTIDLKSVGAHLVRHKRSAGMPRLLNPAPAADYTGIVIIAEEELPVHGKKIRAGLTPCLFPKIWDTEMNLIYDKSMTEPEWDADFSMVHYTGADSIFQNNPSGISGELQRIVGDKPLRVIARGVFGINPTDPIIDRADAVTILSSETNRRLLAKGRVAFIVPSNALNRELL